jgi:hypothetical protein
MCTRPRQHLSDALLPCSLALSSVGQCWTCPSAREGRIAYGNKRPGQSLVQISRRGSTDVHGPGDPLLVRSVAARGTTKSSAANPRAGTRWEQPWICAGICTAVGTGGGVAWWLAARGHTKRLRSPWTVAVFFFVRRRTGFCWDLFSG